MKTRIAGEKDATELIKLIQIADNRSLKTAAIKVKKYIKSKNGFFLIAQENKKIVGYLLLAMQDNYIKAKKFIDISRYARICWIAMHPSYRGRKIGSKLLKKSENLPKNILNREFG